MEIGLEADSLESNVCCSVGKAQRKASKTFNNVFAERDIYVNKKKIDKQELIFEEKYYN